MVEERNESEQWIGPTPHKCQICDAAITDYFIDGRVNFGFDAPWGFMCEACHTQHGCGFGPGKAQMYRKQGDLYMRVAPGQTNVNGTQEGNQ